MANDVGTPKNNDKKPLSSVDPAIEAKVDKMMSPTGAPLLPDDKLPDFDKKQPSGNIKSLATPVADKSPAKEPASATDTETDKAVDEIAEKESDRILAMEDAKAELLSEGTAEIDRGFFNRVKSKFIAFWHNKTIRNSCLAAIFLIVLTVFVIPASRYFILNSLGVRASMSLRVIDDKTQQPLKNVEVAINDKLNKTDIKGEVKLTGIKLGKQHLAVKKPAFADFNQDVIIGWGSNPRGDTALKAVGSRYTFEIKDYVSGKPVINSEATSGVASATANQNGEIVLVVANQNEEVINVQISSKNYRTENINLQVGNNDIHQISLVPAKKHAFVSKRSGKYDLYKIGADGKNEQRVLAGTGSEKEDSIVILPSPTSNTIAYVTIRGERHNTDGFALSSLMIVNLDNDQSETIDYSERIQPIEFIGNRLVYVKISEGESGSSPNRHQLISYDVDTGQQKILAKTNYFNDVLAAKGNIYYAPAAYKVGGNVGLFKISPDGSDRSTVYDKEVWNLFRVAYDKLDAAVGQNWYEYGLDSGAFHPLSEAPAQEESRIYTDSPDGKKSAWVDKRDGKGVLIIYDTATGQDTVRLTEGGLVYPVSWLDDDHLVYRIATSSETADYVISLSGGSPKKITDVTNTAGLDRWYYY